MTMTSSLKFIRQSGKGLTLALLSAAATLVATPAYAQQPHGIAATVNDDVITTRDLQQRVMFNLMAAGVAPDEASLQRLQLQAMRALVDERLQMQEAKKFDLEISDAEVERRVGALAASNQVSIEQLAQQMASVGISLDTLRDQVRSEIAWQRIVNGRYGTRIRISDAQIDETLGRLTANADKPSYLISEIFIEATPDIGGMDGAMEGSRAMIAQVNQGAPFTALARQFSSSATAAKGGDVGWVRQGELRAELDQAISTMKKGTLSDPIVVPGGVYVIALRDTKVSESEVIYNLQQIRVPAEGEAAIEAARQALVALKPTLTSCDAVEEAAATIEGGSAADMGEIRSSELGGTIAQTLADTAENELSDPIIAPNGAMALMVCERTVTGKGIPTRDEVEDRLIDQQIAQQSKRYLRDIRRSATIESR